MARIGLGQRVGWVPCLCFPTRPLILISILPKTAQNAPKRNSYSSQDTRLTSQFVIGFAELTFPNQIRTL